MRHGDALDFRQWRRLSAVLDGRVHLAQKRTHHLRVGVGILLIDIPEALVPSARLLLRHQSGASSAPTTDARRAAPRPLARARHERARVPAPSIAKGCNGKVLNLRRSRISRDELLVSWALGAGIDYALIDEIYVRGEDIYYDLGSQTVRATATATATAGGHGA